MFRFPGGYRFLQVAFIILPILAGLDKFFNLLAYWPQYLSPLVVEMLNGQDAAFMMAVGVIEIIAGIGNIIVPKVFGFIVAAWLLLIIGNLVSMGQYYDVAARDLGLLLCALALGILSFRSKTV
jgi:hypothetical protein